MYNSLINSRLFSYCNSLYYIRLFRHMNVQGYSTGLMSASSYPCGAIPK